MNEYELYHHGIKGMRWGVRRYQNKDGSLTPAGKRKYGTKANFEKVQSAKNAVKRYNSRAARAKRKADARTEEEIAKYKAKLAEKKSLNKSDGPKKKALKDMTDDELNQSIRRLQLEQQYKSLNPEPVSKGKAFVDDVVRPAAKTAGKEVLTSYLTKMGKKALGVDSDAASEVMSELAKEAKEAGYRKQIAEAETAMRRNRREQAAEEREKEKKGGR